LNRYALLGHAGLCYFGLLHCQSEESNLVPYREREGAVTDDDAERSIAVVPAAGYQHGFIRGRDMPTKHDVPFFYRR
jgi:hypothetical protein